MENNVRHISPLLAMDKLWETQGWSGSMVWALVFTLATVGMMAMMLRRGRAGRGAQRLPPGPRPLPLIGNLHQVGDASHQTFWAMAKKYGPVMYLRLGVNPLVVVSSAAAAQEFVKVQDKVWAGRPPSISGKIFTNNYRNIVWAPYGSHWRHMKKICTLELFTQKRLESFRPLRAEEFGHMVRSMYEDTLAGKPVLLTMKLGHLATNNVTRMCIGKRLFGVDEAGREEAHHFKELVFALFTVTSNVIVGDFLPWLKWATHASGYIRHMKKVKANLDGFLQQFLDVKKSIPHDEKREARDFVDLLLAQPSENGDGRLDDDAIKGVLQDMLVAGTDTSSTTAEWGISELIRHPECMLKLQSELDTVVGKDRNVAETDIPNLPYLQAVVKEIFRLYPTTPLNLPHESIEPTSICGFDLPAHTWLFINFYAIQRDPAVWENPNVFDPERFVAHPEIDMRGTHFGLIPFGAGRRQCPGMPLGILYVQMTIARLSQAFTFSLPGGQEPRTLDMQEKFALTMPRKSPLTVIATPRLPVALYYN